VQAKLWIPISLGIASLLLAGLTYLSFVRPIASKTATGTIAAKRFLPAETVVRHKVSARRELIPEQKFEVPDRYRFQIRLDGSAELVSYSLPVAAARGYEVGRRVKVIYETRGILGMWKRNNVRTISLVAPRSGNDILRSGPIYG
jgi:hypothetical protein